MLAKEISPVELAVNTVLVIGSISVKIVEIRNYLGELFHGRSWIKVTLLKQRLAPNDGTLTSNKNK